MNSDHAGLIARPVIGTFYHTGRIHGGQLTLSFFNDNNSNFRHLTGFTTFLTVVRLLGQLILRVLNKAFSLIFLHRPLFYPSIIIVLGGCDQSIRILFRCTDRPLRGRICAPKGLPALQMGRQGKRQLNAMT